MTQSTMAKHDRAIELRDLALAVVKARGEPEQSRHGFTILRYNDGQLQIAYREATEIFWHSLDIWRHTIDGMTTPHKHKMNRVLSVVWLDSNVRVVSYPARWLQWEQT